MPVWVLGGDSYRAIGEIAPGLPPLRVPTFTPDRALIAAVGTGRFVPNILTIRRLADLQSEGLQVIDAQADLDRLACAKLQPEERTPIGYREAALKVRCLSGPMVFGTLKFP